MTGREEPLDQFETLTWEDIKAWAGSRHFYMGLTCHQDNRVSDLSISDDDDLIAWVKGSEQYVTKVYMINDGFPNSICTCSQEVDCKHGVAIVLEYQKLLETNQKVPLMSPDDERLMFFLPEDPIGHVEGEEDVHNSQDSHDVPFKLSEEMATSIDGMLKQKTKAELMDLIHKLTRLYPEIAEDIIHHNELVSGNIQSLMASLRREIFEVSNDSEEVEQMAHNGTPRVFSGVRDKLENLIKVGHADTVLVFGEELLSYGSDLVVEGDIGSETVEELYECMPIIVNALKESSLKTADKLAWSVNTVLNDPYDMSEAFHEYLYEKHDKKAWSELVDQLMARLLATRDKKNDDNLSVQSVRDRLADWTIHAMERSDRKNEIIPLCESEIGLTKNYERLVSRLISIDRYEEAESWIHIGIEDTRIDHPSITSHLKEQLEILFKQKENWKAIAAMRVDKFTESPDAQSFTRVKIFSEKVNVWEKVRVCLLKYLENGILPENQKEWPLPDSGLDRSLPDRETPYPLISVLINIAMSENNPEKVLYWYDRIDENESIWYGVDDDEVAEIIESYDPGRSVQIWKAMAEKQFQMSHSKDYLEAENYLKKAGRLLIQEKKEVEWKNYLTNLKEKHSKEWRLVEMLNKLDQSIQN